MPRKKKNGTPETAVGADAEAEGTAVAPKRKPGRPKKSTTEAATQSKPRKKTRMRYDAETKARIIAAARGKKLSEGYAAAQEVGYKGTPQSLYQMLYVAAGKKPGRPKGSKSKVGRPAKVSVGSLSSIEQVIEHEVQSRVSAALQAVIAELEKQLS